MPRELDASLRQMRYSAAEGPHCSPKCNRHLSLSAIHQNFFMAAFHYLSRGLATYFTAVQPIVNLNFFFFFKLVLKEQFIRQFAAFMVLFILLCAG